MAFCSLEGRYGEIELVVFPKVLAAGKQLFDIGSAIAVKGEISARDDETPKLLVSEAIALVPDSKLNTQIPPMVQAAPASRTESRVQTASKAPLRRAPQTEAAAEAAPRAQDGKNEAAASDVQKKHIIYVKVEKMYCPEFKRAVALCEIFSGQAPVVFFAGDTGKYIKSNLMAAPTGFLLNELKEVAGEKNVVLK